MKHFILFFGLFSCLGCKTYTIDNLPEEYLTFGKGGGFSGAIETHTLLKNGQFFQHNSLQKDTLTLPKIKRKQVKNCFEKAAALDWEKAAMNEPSNRYRFLEYVEEGVKNRIVWGREKDNISEEVKILYEELSALIERGVDEGNL